MKAWNTLKGTARLVGFSLLGLSFISCAYHKAEMTGELKSSLAEFDGKNQPLEDFFKEAEYSQLKISPDGKFIAALFPKNGINSLGVLSGDLTKLVFTFQFEEGRHIMGYQWINNTRLMLMTGKKFGYLDGRRADQKIFFVDYDGKNFRNFFAQGASFYNMIRTLPDDPDNVIMAKFHGRDRGRPLVVKFNVNTGKEKLLDAPPIKYGSYLADINGEVNVAVENDPKVYDKSKVHYRLGKDSPWVELAYPVKGDSQLKPLSLDVKNKTLLIISSRETGRDALYRLDLASGKSTLVSSDPKVDVEDVIHDKERIVAVGYQPDYPEIEIIEKDSIVSQLYTELQAMFKGDIVSSISLTKDQSEGLFAVHSDKNPGQFYKITVKDRKIVQIGTARPWIKPEKHGCDETHHIQSAGWSGNQRLSHAAPKGPQKNLPAVLVVHGGPHGVRDDWGFNPEAQFLASRGFAVLQVNYRGSGGYGQKFLESGYRQWGLKMQDDLTDATNWLVKEGYADAKRLAIYGGSYGGYAAFMATVREPDLYRCAISYVGVSDLTIQANDSDTVESEAGQDYIRKALGEDNNDLKKRSALYNVDKIKVPIFIAGGKDDVRVPYSNSERMKDALEKAHKPYEFMAKDSEGHGYQQPANRYDFYMHLAKFLEKNTSVTH